MAKQNTEALVEAIRGAMEDFNSKINEHLGENFKQLNEGVGVILQINPVKFFRLNQPELAKISA